ncbi:hypothetical protein J6590_102036 [Homalodisca vitripennis]|nr:hypothetical protein J6590_102036 [Homalodisca vitripennis]
MSLKIERLMNPEECTCLMAHEHAVGGVIGEVSLFGGLYVREVYSVFLRDLQRECNGAGSTDDGLNERVTLEKFAYDWTRGVHYAAEKLYVYLSTMSRGYHAIALIAHSMGGLVCRYLLEVLVYAKRAYDETARHLYRSVKLLYAIGVPHYGALRALYGLVDPENRELSKLCRDIQSLFDMIPFSDLTSQVEGFGSVSTQRYRSAMFLKRTVGTVTVDGKHWRTGTVTPGHVSGLVSELMRRFPELRDHSSRLFRGAAVHFALKSANKPTGCVYFCVNAVGLGSPSLIDKHDRLFRECTSGDGTICNVITASDECINTRPRRGRRRRQPRKTYSVHVKMLSSIDVFKAVREVLGSDVFGDLTTGTGKGFKYLWRSFIGERTGGEEVVSSFTDTLGSWTVTANNLRSGCCVLSVRAAAADNSSPHEYRGGINIGVVAVPVHSDHRRPNGEEDLKRIRVTADEHWTSITPRQFREERVVERKWRWCRTLRTNRLGGRNSLWYICRPAVVLLRCDR